jgi:hypothetical protein
MLCITAAQRFASALLTPSSRSMVSYIQFFVNCACHPNHNRVYVDHDGLDGPRIGCVIPPLVLGAGLQWHSDAGASCPTGRAPRVVWSLVTRPLAAAWSRALCLILECSTARLLTSSAMLAGWRDASIACHMISVRCVGDPHPRGHPHPHWQLGHLQEHRGQHSGVSGGAGAGLRTE